MLRAEIRGGQRRQKAQPHQHSLRRLSSKKTTDDKESKQGSGDGGRKHSLPTCAAAGRVALVHNAVQMAVIGGAEEAQATERAQQAEIRLAHAIIQGIDNAP